jgi:hypothetical protein
MQPYGDTSKRASESPECRLLLHSFGSRGIVKLFRVAKGNDDLSQYDPELTRSANPGKHSGLS